METIAVPTRQFIADYDDDINAINLQLQEIQSYSSSEKQKYPEGRAPDREMAIHDFETELGKFLIVLGDQRFARSIQRAIDHDAVALTEFTAGEDQARRDRAMAQRIGNEVTNGEDLESLSGDEEVKENNWTLEGAPYTIPIIEPDGGDAAGPSVSRIQHRHTDLGPFSSSIVDCVACGDAFHLPELIPSPCGHLYCSDCLKLLFVRATTDETLFPPRCCSQIISLSLVEAKLSTGALSDFNSAAIEFTTTNRTYCVRKDCGKFIPPHEIRSGRAVCRNCNAETCAYCKGVLHDGDCLEDEALQAVLELAQGERWRRCFGCNTMVELNTGCNHITCKCSAEFCYTCGLKWKTCTCDAWEERHLLNRAEEVVDREVNRPMAAPERQRRVVQMQRELLANHECNHPGRWERQEGYHRKGYKCEICSTRHWKYILKCRHCHLIACEECRRHRV